MTEYLLSLPFARFGLFLSTGGMVKCSQRIYPLSRDNPHVRYSSGRGKRSAEVFHRGTLSEGMQVAIGEVKNGYARMIEGWKAG
jgi:hypothetical protein